MKLRTICFDLDNTLVDRDAACRHYWSLFIERHAPAFQTDGPQRALERLLIEDCHGWTGRREFFTWVAATYPELGQSPEQLWSDYWDELPRYITTYPGVPELLAWLQSRFQLTLVSNGSSALQRSKLARCELEGYFAECLFPAKSAWKNPTRKSSRKWHAGVAICPGKSCLWAMIPRGTLWAPTRRNFAPAG